MPTESDPPRRQPISRAPATEPATGPSHDTGGRLRALFEAALEQAGPARAAWIQAHVADAGERAAVQRLLAADAAGPGALEVPAIARAARIGDHDEAAADGLVGQRIGAFRLLRVLGQGGMATVFLARREDADFDQQVAVKLLRRGLYSQVEQRLFRRERRALATLSHPNIAHLLDGGITDAGIPYLVMEYIDGVPITRHAADLQLDVHARLRLFVVACHAVAAAHRALIVHRDIKPSNLLVTPGGEVKLLDFGIAKLLDDDDGATRSGLAALTPEYAAPEQLAGGAISTATDVYALGVLLHELLLGVRPAHADPRRPSARLAEPSAGAAALPAPRPALRAALRGDLDNILLKALAAEPDRRYASAGALAEDVERHLQAQPVAAHPPSNWYRTRKFVQRHRGGVLVTALFALGLVGSLGAALWQARVARAEALQARAMQDFLASLFEPLRLGQSADQAPTLQELLEAGVTRLDQRFAGDAVARAELTALFSRVHAQIGDYATARELAVRAYDLARETHGARDPRTLVALGQRGRTARLQGDLAAALADLERARSGMQAIDLQTIDHAHTLQDLGAVYIGLGRFPEAIATNLAAHGIASRIGSDDPAFGTIMNNLGYAYSESGDIRQALLWQQRAYDWQVARGAGESRAALVALGNVANVKFRLGHWRAAMQDLERLLRLNRNVVGGARNDWSETVQACSAATALGELAKADAYCETALAHASLEGPDSRPRAIALAFRASLRVQQGRYRDARADVARAGRLFRALQGDQGRYLLRLAATGAEMARIQGTPAQAVEALDAVVSSARFDRTDATAPMLLAQLALACAGHSAARCGADHAREAEVLLAAAPNKRHPAVLSARTALARLARQTGNARPEVARLQHALAETADQLGPDHPWVGEAQAALADVAAAAGAADVAAAARREAARIAGLLAVDHPLRTRLQEIPGQAAHPAGAAPAS